MSQYKIAIYPLIAAVAVLALGLWLPNHVEGLPMWLKAFAEVSSLLLLLLAGLLAWAVKPNAAPKAGGAGGH